LLFHTGHPEPVSLLISPVYQTQKESQMIWTGGYKIWVAENMWFYVIVGLTFYVENLAVLKAGGFLFYQEG